jgi:flagellar hook protein FlgE
MVPDKNGFITDAEGDKLMGFSANAQGVLQTTNVVPIQIPNINLPPVATTTITAGVNLNAQAALPKDTPFNPADQNSFNFHTAVPSFDSLGGQSTVDLYFVKTATGQFEVFGGPTGTTPKDLGQMSFDSSGNLTATTSGGAPTAINGQFSLAVTNTDGSAPQTIAIDVSTTTQFGSPNGINNLTADGFGSSTLANYSIGNDGTITGTYTDGRTATLGQVLLATFNDPNGLDNLGNNQFAATAASGVPQVSTPGSTNHGSVQGSATESSNVDLTGSLVDLITAQRNYQANAQTIKTQQTIDQTLINL